MIYNKIISIFKIVKRLLTLFVQNTSSFIFLTININLQINNGNISEKLNAFNNVKDY